MRTSARPFSAKALAPFLTFSAEGKTVFGLRRRTSSFVSSLLTMLNEALPALRKFTSLVMSAAVNSLPVGTAVELMANDLIMLADAALCDCSRAVAAWIMP